METVKSIAAWAISPVILSLLLQLPGWLLWKLGRRKPGLILIGAGTVLLLLGSLPILSFHTNRNQEAKHPPLLNPVALASDRPALAVVLGTGFNPDPELPANSRVSGTFLARLIEGVRLQRGHPNGRLLVSVANEKADPAAKQSFLNDLIRLLALDPQRVSLITDARSTADEVRLAARQRREGEQIIIVTSAGHMPRAMNLFTAAGLAPTPAPCDFNYPRAGSPQEKAWKRWTPTGDAIGSTQQLLYEFLAGFAR